MAGSTTSGHQTISRYDFRESGNQPRPHLRTLVRMHEVLVDRLVPLLARQLRCEVDVELAATELATFDEYVRSMPLVTALTTFRMNPLDGRCAVELNPQLATVMVERMLGGPGTLPQLRRLTNIEGAVLTEVFDAFQQGITDAFAPLIALQPSQGNLVFDPEFLDIAEGQDTVILLAYRVNLRADEVTTEGIFTICYPTTTLAPILRQLSDVDLTGMDDDHERRVGPLVNHLPDVQVPVTVRLNSTTMLARDLAGLVPGDVLRLSHRLEEPAIAHVGDSELFRGHLGQRRRRLSVQISSIRQAPVPEQQDVEAPPSGTSPEIAAPAAPALEQIND